MSFANFLHNEIFGIIVKEFIIGVKYFSCSYRLLLYRFLAFALQTIPAYKVVEIQLNSMKSTRNSHAWLDSCFRYQIEQH